MKCGVSLSKATEDVANRSTWLGCSTGVPGRGKVAVSSGSDSGWHVCLGHSQVGDAVSLSSNINPLDGSGQGCITELHLRTIKGHWLRWWAWLLWNSDSWTENKLKQVGNSGFLFRDRSIVCFFFGIVTAQG